MYLLVVLKLAKVLNMGNMLELSGSLSVWEENLLSFLMPGGQKKSLSYGLLRGSVPSLAP